MSGRGSQTTWIGSLHSLPTGGRVMLTAFLAIVATGYLIGVWNIHLRHQMADGVEGLSLDDVRAVYSGMTVSSDAPSPSRMLTMIQTTMGEYVQSEGDFRVLESWLKRGGRRDELEAGEGERSPRAVLRTCLRCHAADSGEDIAGHAPFGPDDWDVDFAMLSKFLSPTEGAGDGPTRWTPPQYQVPRLVLVSHVHMLSIPMFTLAVGLLFMMTRLPAGPRAVLTPLPMLALAVDLGGWWMARASGMFVYAIAGAGAVFGLAFGLQVLAVAVDLWRPERGSGRE